MIVLDTSVIIDFLSGAARGKTAAELAEDETVAVTSITVNEVLIGVPQAKRPLVRDFLAALHQLPFDSEAAIAAAELEEALNRKGAPIGKLDTFIAAVCLVHGLPLLTADKGFSQVQKLNTVLVK
ncbi:type II toxin-antitoxin system VapC family toxin [Candidatus Woesearchaeota archaeon]|nr:type II toxin-antitoxin system VapC family toxin [Candidatus Woesearchaeota archaeon]